MYLQEKEYKSCHNRCDDFTNEGDLEREIRSIHVLQIHAEYPSYERKRYRYQCHKCQLSCAQGLLVAKLAWLNTRSCILDTDRAYETLRCLHQQRTKLRHQFKSPAVRNNTCAFYTFTRVTLQCPDRVRAIVVVFESPEIT